MRAQTLFALVFFAAAIYIGVTQDITDLSGNVVDELTGQVTRTGDAEIPFEGESIRVANWNVQVFGVSKWSKPEVRAQIVDIVDDYDIIFIQEIRDASEATFPQLCDAVATTHDCIISSRAGRSSSKEQIGVLYGRNIGISEVVDYNEDERLREILERPPLQVTFTVDDYTFTAINSHVKPGDVENELEVLQNIAGNVRGNVMILGDLNADGSYYDEDNRAHFLDYFWIIDNSVDTTVAASDNTYDRIIVNDYMYAEYVSHDVYDDIDKEVSDHYLVWAEIAVGER